MVPRQLVEHIVGILVPTPVDVNGKGYELGVDLDA